jgi:hypothetical protein
MVTNQTALDARVMPMRRSLLITLLALGSLVCLIGSTGLFAALTDIARTGTNTVDSASLAASADIQLATATFDAVTEATTCGTFSEDLTTGVFTVGDIEPGYGSDSETFTPAFFCIKNVGSEPVTISASADELVDMETGCTGDEALHGDATCGGDQLGELSSVLSVVYNRWECDFGISMGGDAATLNANAGSTPVAFFDALAPGEHACFSVYIAYFADGIGPDVQKAQSDQSTWRFKFAAQA